MKFEAVGIKNQLKKTVRNAVVGHQDKFQKWVLSLGMRLKNWLAVQIRDQRTFRYTVPQFSRLIPGQVNSVPTDRPSQPNILFILSDDQGYFDVGYQGSEILTPNIDQLAKDGVKLENYYVTQGMK